jgi:hypothetical protein
MRLSAPGTCVRFAKLWHYRLSLRLCASGGVLMVLH